MTPRSKAREQWQRVADGDLDKDLLKWLRATANAILTADDLPAAKRRDGIVKALNLQYRQTPHSELADTVSIVKSFPFLAKDGQERQPRRGEEIRSLIATVRHAMPEWEEKTDDEIRKTLTRMIARKV
jgi:hypothetical protein